MWRMELHQRALHPHLDILPIPKNSTIVTFFKQIAHRHQHQRLPSFWRIVSILTHLQQAGGNRAMKFQQGLRAIGRFQLRRLDSTSGFQALPILLDRPAQTGTPFQRLDFLPADCPPSCAVESRPRKKLFSIVL
jgi:hypothetical protein